MPAPDLDRYYTPPVLATEMVGAAGIDYPVTYLDSTCGLGHLLEAAHVAKPSASIVGIDSDGQAIRRLRRRWPSWTLKVGDALANATWSKVRTSGPAVALLNPPFSMGTRKGLRLALPYAGTVRCSVAMAHLVRACLNQRPTVVVAIVPESLFFSDLDAEARRLLGKGYSIEVVRGIRNSTFAGARANALVVKLTRRPQLRNLMDVSSEPACASLVRGGLPLFEARTSRKGMLLIHSTDLREIAEAGLSRVHRRVIPINRGQVSGHVVLFPRVGVPRPEQIRPIWLKERAQLSDCVLAYKAADARSAERIASHVVRYWRSFAVLYRGTGARYVTVARLGSWFRRALMA